MSWTKRYGLVAHNRSGGFDHLTWYAGTQRNKGDGGDRIGEANGAAEVRRHVADDGRQDADTKYRHHETDIAAEHICTKTKSKLASGFVNRFTLKEQLVMSKVRGEYLN